MTFEFEVQCAIRYSVFSSNSKLLFLFFGNPENNSLKKIVCLQSFKVIFTVGLCLWYNIFV